MARHDRVALIKTGRSDDYAGGQVVGRHANLSQRGEGHERFNFFAGPDGQFYGYAPPIGGFFRPPQPKQTQGWLLVFVAAHNGHGPLVVVGWYAGATISTEYLERPEYQVGDPFETDVSGEPYTYCLSAPAAHLLPVAGRQLVIPGNHFRRTPVLYLRGNNDPEDWRKSLARSVLALVRRQAVDLDQRRPSFKFPDAEHRKRVEKAAVSATKKLLSKEFRVTSREKDNLGYDLLASQRKTSRELHVEVKGTSGRTPHFFLTRKEALYISDRRWRLAMVTDALTKPRVQILTESEVRGAFEIEPFAWEGVARVR